MNTRSKKIQNYEAPCNGVLRVRLYDSGGNKIPIKGAGIEVLEWKLSEWQHIETPVSYTHLRAHETVLDIVCRLLLEKKKKYILENSKLLDIETTQSSIL